MSISQEYALKWANSSHIKRLGLVKDMCGVAIEIIEGPSYRGRSDVPEMDYLITFIDASRIEVRVSEGLLPFTELLYFTNVVPNPVTTSNFYVADGSSPEHYFPVESYSLGDIVQQDDDFFINVGDSGLSLTSTTTSSVGTDISVGTPWPWDWVQYPDNNNAS